MSFEIWHAVVLGLVEGITEYLPISSTGHLIIAADLMKLDTPEMRESVNAFNIVVQGGAILAVVGLYWPRFVQMLKGLAGRDKAGLNLLACLGIAFMPAAIAGVLRSGLILPSPGFGLLLLASAVFISTWALAPVAGEASARA